MRYWQRRRNTHTYKKPHHRHQHEQEYEKRAAMIEDILKHKEALFNQPPPNDDCPICLSTLPSLMTGRKYQTCCGKVICSGCMHAVIIMDEYAKCPFCRSPHPKSDEEIVERTKKRVEKDDAIAIHNLGWYYHMGNQAFHKIGTRH